MRARRAPPCGLIYERFPFRAVNLFALLAVQLTTGALGVWVHVRVMGLPLWFPGNFVTDIETRGSFFSRNRSERQHQEQLHHAAPLVARAEIRASRLGICSYYRWLCVVGATMSIFSLHRSLTLSALLIMMLAI